MRLGPLRQVAERILVVVGEDQSSLFCEGLDGIVRLHWRESVPLTVSMMRCTCHGLVDRAFQLSNMTLFSTAGAEDMKIESLPNLQALKSYSDISGRADLHHSSP